MIISLVLALFVTASGTISTYLYDEAASFASRLCAGACTGLAALGLVGFVIASFLGLTPLAIVLTVLVLAIPFVTLRDATRRQAVEADLSTASHSIRRSLLHPTKAPFGYILFYAAISVVLWRSIQPRNDRRAGWDLHRCAEQLRRSAIPLERDHQLRLWK